MKYIDLQILKKLISEYREDGKKLMFELGKKYNLDITIDEEYDKLISRNSIIERKGNLTQRWNYSFHGGECLFYNKKHNQIVQVVLTNPPNFGELNAWFVMEYINSTPKFKNKFEGIDWLEIKEAINTLYINGEIERVQEG